MPPRSTTLRRLLVGEPYFANEMLRGPEEAFTLAWSCRPSAGSLNLKFDTFMEKEENQDICAFFLHITYPREEDQAGACQREGSVLCGSGIRKVVGSFVFEEVELCRQVSDYCVIGVVERGGKVGGVHECCIRAICIIKAAKND